MKRHIRATIISTITIFSVISAANYDFTTLADTFHLDPATYGYADKTEIGQGRVGPVNGELWDVTVPLNRVTWAIAIAHGHQLMRNILRMNIYPSALFFATALKESSLGCDANITQPASLKHPIKQIWDTGDGFYQIEGWEGSAYGEMTKMYPKRFPAGKHADLIGDDHFETATISKVYYDLMVLLYWKYKKQYRPIELFDNSTDTHGILKMVSAAYYMGHQGVDSFYNYVFNTNRTDSYLNNYMTFFDADPYGSDSFYQNAKTHAEKVSQVVYVFQDSASKEGIPETNYFTSYYDTSVALADVHLYIDKIAPLYPDADTTSLRVGADSVFNSINNGGDINFQDDIGKIIDYLILNLPADNPVPGIQTYYPFTWDESLDYEPDFDDGTTAVLNHLKSFNNHLNLKQIKNMIQLCSKRDEIISLNLFDLRGRNLFKRSISLKRNQKHFMDFEKSFSSGYYLIEIISGENFKSSLPIIIR